MVKINYDISKKSKLLEIEAFTKALHELRIIHPDFQHIFIDKLKNILETRILNENNSMTLIEIVSFIIKDVEKDDLKNFSMLLHTYFYPEIKALMRYLNCLSIDGEVA
jgi:hypothetical protein